VNDRFAAAWPFFGLRISTPMLELVYPTDELIPDLINLATQGIHEPGFMPFSVGWSSLDTPDLDRGMAQFYWRNRAELSPNAWSIPFVVSVDGEPIGLQDALAKDFPVLRIAETGSWLGKEHQGTGIGTEMRAAILHLLFEGLGAERATTRSRYDNPSSLGVTQKLGYEPNGTSLEDYGDGKPWVTEHFFLSRDSWQHIRRDDIEITGLADCLDMLGLASSTSDVSESEVQ
jgi:RimJ/RimL family protein N-acetyltransferase